MSFDLQGFANAAKGKQAADLYLTYEGELFTYAELGWCDWIVTWIRDCFTDYKIANICHVFERALLQYYSEKSSLPPAQIISKREGLELFVKIFDANKAAFDRYASSDIKVALTQYTNVEKNIPVAPREEKDAKDSRIDASERFGALTRQVADLGRAKADLETTNATLLQDNLRLGDRIATLEQRAQRAEAQSAAAPKMPQEESATIQKLMQRIKKHEQDYAVQLDRVHAVEAEKAELARNNAQVLQTSRQAKEQLEITAGALKQLREEHAQLQLAYESLKEAKPDQPASDQQLLADNTKLRQQVTFLQDALKAAAKKASENSPEVLDDLERQIKVFRRCIGEKETEIAALKGRLTEVQVKKGGEITALQKELASAQQQIARLEKAVKKSAYAADDQYQGPDPFAADTQSSASWDDGKEKSVQNGAGFDVAADGESDES